MVPSRGQNRLFALVVPFLSLTPHWLVVDVLALQKQQFRKQSGSRCFNFVPHPVTMAAVVNKALILSPLSTARRASRDCMLGVAAANAPDDKTGSGPFGRSLRGLHGSPFTAMACAQNALNLTSI